MSHPCCGCLDQGYMEIHLITSNLRASNQVCCSVATEVDVTWRLVAASFVVDDAAILGLGLCDGYLVDEWMVPVASSTMVI